MYHPHRASPPPTQSSSILTFNLDDDNFEPLWAFASQTFTTYERSSNPLMTTSPVEEVAVGNEKKYMRSVTLSEEWTNSSLNLDHEEEDHSKWRKVEMPKFFNSKKTSSKKSRTSETTSQGNSDSAHIGVDLNDEAADSEDVEVQEVRPMGRDAAKKKRSSSGARSESSVAGDPSLVDALVSKFTMAARPFFSSRKESSSEYLRIKERELELEDQKRREQGELERLKIAQRDKELELQQKKCLNFNNNKNSRRTSSIIMKNMNI
ncbi:hypothetical protein Tco_0488351 [Tanacetum coccineum]